MLAIVIPAYKSSFLKKALESIANQTNKSFVLYVGDDASPFELDRIVKEFDGSIEIVYKKFEHNLGRKDLVAQWERCVDLVKDEEYLWLFSDDDVMDSNCVREFYNVVEKQKNDVYHFNINFIDEQDNVKLKCPEFPPLLSVYDFYYQVFTSKIMARMPEFIFNKKRFYKNGRFHKYDLAYRTDTATVMKNALIDGIITIPNCIVSYRLSEESISCAHLDAKTFKKIKATIMFFSWAKTLFKNNNVRYPLSFKMEARVMLWEIIYPIYKKYIKYIWNS